MQTRGNGNRNTWTGNGESGEDTREYYAAKEELW